MATIRKRERERERDTFMFFKFCTCQHDMVEPHDYATHVCIKLIQFLVSKCVLFFIQLQT
jgi:hypothetical protein